MAFVWFANLSLATHMAPTMATMQNLLGPRMRAMSSAIAFLAANLLGAGLGPTMLGMASDIFASHAFAAGDFLASCPGGRAPAGAETAVDVACRSASAQGLRLALLSSLVFFPWAVAHYVLAAKTLKQDLYAPHVAP
jgi:hypothetical protein